MASTHDYEFDQRNKDIQIYINGEFYNRDNAKISVFDSGFLLGDGVWEGIRLYKGHLVHLGEHLNRLLSGAKAIDMEIGRTKEEIEKSKSQSVSQIQDQIHEITKLTLSKVASYNASDDEIKSEVAKIERSIN